MKDALPLAIAGVLLLVCQVLVLQLVLGWFDVSFTFWQSLITTVLINSFTAERGD